MHFCLASPDREAPSVQTWRLMSIRSHEDCTTEMLTLIASPSEGWKLHPDDEMISGHEEQADVGTLTAEKLMGGSIVFKQDELGDNLAEEGVLGQSA
jgi:hypothetical protein